MHRWFLAVGLVATAALTAGSVSAGGAATTTPLNVDVSQRSTSESEQTIAVNPTNPKNVVIVTNIEGAAPGLFAAVSFDGGSTWAKRIIGNNDNLGDACCDPSLAFDEYGNLFLTYLYNVEISVPIALSLDGGLNFNLITNVVKPPKSAVTAATRDSRGLFRYVDQPTITAANGAVWIVVNAGGGMFATGAPVSGFGQVGSFFAGEAVPGTSNCTYGDVSIGPAGQVIQACALTQTGQGGGTVRVSVDPDGLGPAGFGKIVSVVDTHIGGFDFIPAQSDRSID